RSGGGGQGPGGMSSLERGPDFFADGVKDDPQPSLFYDPQRDSAASDNSSVVPSEPQWHAAGLNAAQPIQLTRFEEQQPPAPPAQGGGLDAPRADVTVEALPQLGGIVVRARNAEDMKRI